MTLGIRYAARSDVGMLREGNEDSAYAGTHLLAVADGMGGHVGGEIASAAAISELRKLDKDLPAPELLVALEHTVKAANDNLHRIVESDPALQGMGTTLTAMLWAGDQVALVHIGDSRAYLLRDGSLFQITHDHTLVQQLVDEGRISPDEAASHPQRSLLLRALDGRGEVDPDLSLREGRVGDRYLLCSDGLSGVVTAETIFQVLTEVEEPEQAVRQLIDLANRGGGPDNINCVVADVIELGGPPPTGTSGQAVGAAANPRTPETPGGPGGAGAAPGAPADTPAGRAAQLRDTMPQPPVVVDERPQPQPQPQPYPVNEPGSSPPQAGLMAGPPPGRGGGARRWAWLIGFAGVFVIGVAAVGIFTVQSMKGGYYIGEQDGKVVLFRGTTQDLPLLDMSDKANQQPDPPIMVTDLPKPKQQEVKDTYVVDGPKEADELQKIRCRYVLSPEGGRVVVVRGKGQQNCQPSTVDQSELEMGDLPNSDAAAIKAGKRSFVAVQAAKAELTRLGQRVDECKSEKPKLTDCPSTGGRS